jgi:hypothetical protein
MVVREDGCVNALSFANASFYEEKFARTSDFLKRKSRERGKEEKGEKARRRYRIDSMERERNASDGTRRREKRMDVFIFYFVLRNQSCCNRALSFFFFFFSSSISRSSFRRDLSLSLLKTLSLSLSLSLA